LQWTEKSPGIFYLQDLLTFKDYDELADEFRPINNHWGFNKSEKHGQEPSFGHLLDCRNNKTLGANYKLIDVGSKLKLYCQKILRKNVDLMRISTNIQFFGQESNFHVDSGPEMHWWTLVLFANMQWSTEWGGELTIQTGPSDYLGLPYIPNCGVLFDGSIPHKGSAPNRFAIVERRSVAFSFALLD